MNDLEMHHKLKNRITVLEKLVIKHENAANSAKALLSKSREKGQRSFKAKILLELRRDGVIDWGFDEIADACFLGVATVKNYNSEMNK